MPRQNAPFVSASPAATPARPRTPGASAQPQRLSRNRSFGEKPMVKLVVWRQPRPRKRVMH
jgi:hypothetical protein